MKLVGGLFEDTGGQKGDFKINNTDDFVVQILPLKNSFETFKCYEKFIPLLKLSLESFVNVA